MTDMITNQRDHIFEIILNRPEKRNAIRVQMLGAIAKGIKEAEQIPDVCVVILRGEGDCFSAGLDFMTMGGMPEALGDNWMQHGYQATQIWQDNLLGLRRSQLPTIALLHSYTLGAGLEIALACDFRIAADDAIISLEEARLGLIPDVGGTTHLVQLVGAARAKELIFTGKRIDAATAERWGLVNQVVAAEDLMSAGDALAKEISQSAPLAVSAAKRVINAIEGVEEGLHLEMVEQNRLFYSEDFAEGIQSRVERREANWKGK